MSARSDPSKTSNDGGNGIHNRTAMNLWQKFSDMQHGIEAARKQRDQLQTELGACIDESAAQKEKRQIERVEANALEEEIQVLNDKVKKLQQEYHSAQTLLSVVSRDKENLDSKMGRWKEYKTEEYQCFLQESIDFQVKNKEMQVSANTSGLRLASISAAIFADSRDPSDLYNFDSTCLHQTQRLNDVHEWNAETDPTTWTIPKGDANMLELFNKYQKEKTEFGKSEEELKIKIKMKIEVAEKSKTRSDKLQLLSKQLDRISKENIDLNIQVSEAQMLTEGAKALRDNYKHRKLFSLFFFCCFHFQFTISVLFSGLRNTTSVIPSPDRRTIQTIKRSQLSSHNPYFRSASCVTNAPVVKRPRRMSDQDSSPTTTLGSPPVSFSAPVEKKVQPYRLGSRRTRRDRQFGSSLQVLGGKSNDKGGGISEQHVDSISSAPISGLSSQNVLISNEIEDEDDDPVLSFVAFTKKE